MCNITVPEEKKCKYCGAKSYKGKICTGCYEKLRLLHGWKWQYKRPEKV